MSEVDNFIGQRFGKDGHLKVIGVCESVKGKARKYKLVCSTCEKDELFVGSVYTAVKQSLVEGKLPCNCSGKRSLTEEQQTKKILRECAFRGVEFIEYVGEYKNIDTRLKLRCLKDGHEWETCSVDKFFQRRGCPKCALDFRAMLKTQTEDEAIQRFIATGAFKEGTRFWKTPTKTIPSCYTYYCPGCSVDEYVEAGLCSGVFTTNRKALALGHLCCRCSSRFIYSREQREYQINKIVAEESLHYKLVGWKSIWKGTSTIARICCEEHGEFFPAVRGFVSNGTRCPSCAISGFKVGKDACLYVLRVSSEHNEFTGYGITNLIKARLSTHRKNFKRSGYIIAEMELFYDKGDIILDVENSIKGNFPVVSQSIEGFKTEATYNYLFNDLVSFVDDKLNSKGEADGNN